MAKYQVATYTKLTGKKFDYTAHILFIHCSLVTFTEAYVSYVIPKTGYNESTKSYFVTVTVCLIIPKPTTIDVSIATNLTDTPIPPVQKVSTKAKTRSIRLFWQKIPISAQYISVTTLTHDFSECYTVQSDPIAASVIEDKYLWWPVGVKLPPAPPTLVETSTNVTIMKNVRKNDYKIKFVSSRILM